MHKRIKVVAVALAVIALASLVMAGLGSAQVKPAAVQYASAVWSKSYGFGSFINVEDSWKTLLWIKLPSLPSNLYYHVVCDGYVACAEETELLITIGVDSATADDSTRRYYGHSTTPKQLTGIHTERVYRLGGGAHTFYFLGRRVLGVGLVRINYHTITVTVFTDGGLTEL